ncbi:MAG: hypothetical protein H8D32_06120 [Dehalococcoidia bacterium]|nr:hypothetical protein [Dehalococcoidia bacterium]
MRRYLLVPLVLLLVVVFGSAAWGGCAAPSAPAGPPAAPEVKLNRVEIVKYEKLADNFPEGYDALRVGFFELGLIFDVTNPNDYPIKLDELHGTIAFEGAPGKWFGVGAAAAYEYQWIPPNYTNQARLNALFTTRVVMLSLLLPGAVMMQEMGVSWTDMIKKWWDETPDFKYKIRVNGDATFTSPQGDVTSTFSEVFPQ